MQDFNQHCISFQDVLDAAKNIQGIAYKTPVMTCSSINNLLIAQNNNSNNNHLRLFFKVEAMQRTGSFKFRGALNAIQSLVSSSSIGGSSSCSSSNHTSKDDNDIVNTLHVVTHSSGNHAAAVALAAKLASSSSSSLNIQATIVMPENAPQIKMEGVKGYGGTIVMVESTNEAREEKADEIVKQDHAHFIHPSENVKVIAGQGTVCLEFVEQVRRECGVGGEDLDVVIIPVGGGGLAAGNAVALRGLLGNRVKIILAEPKELDDAKRSKEAGMLLKHNPGNQLNSVADGLKTTLGPNTWPIIRDLVDDIITVTEYEILHATKLIWERLKVCIEPSAGVGVAVALGEEFQQNYCKDGGGDDGGGEKGGVKNIGIVLCGGNVDVIKISKLMENFGL
mmetsp:Transcript_2109/g.3866  ORF Transcript_2109/g.3866 Transcript_2109/m.3866 type:complete len:394 (-) Transcript_2109:71-1252(-)